mmetsp:Transcript_34417/g.63747  ORF Transcript_34417/g.63747 Transcript_34417/m.63747 type:complete len:211 (-) Transcript_34417:556-1188(-)
MSGMPGSHRFPSRHSANASEGMPQMPIRDAIEVQTLASGVTSPRLLPNQPEVWNVVRPPHRRPATVISSSERLVSFRKTRSPFFKMSSSPKRDSSVLAAFGRLGTCTVRRSDLTSPAPLPNEERRLASDSNFRCSRVFASSTSSGHCSSSSSCTPRKRAATSSSLGRSIFDLGNLRCRNACSMHQPVYMKFLGEKGGVAILTTTLSLKSN